MDSRNEDVTARPQDEPETTEPGNSLTVHSHREIWLWWEYRFRWHLANEMPLLRGGTSGASEHGV